MTKHHLLLLTGVSGSGKSTALNTLEDLGFTCVENLPASLVMPFAEEVISGTAIPNNGKLPESREGHNGYALLVDCRHESSFPSVESARKLLSENGIPTDIIFLDCSDEIAIQRFRETRRKHPLFGRNDSIRTISEALQRERELLSDFRASATRVIDTSKTSVHDLRRIMGEHCEVQKVLTITLQSFGFKYGLPVDIDLLFDVRFLPNPFFEKELQSLTGLSSPVRDFVLQQSEAVTFLQHLKELLLFLIPQYEREGKHYLNIGIGCTGGQHRSVALAEEVASFLRKGKQRIAVFHRDI